MNRHMPSTARCFRIAETARRSIGLKMPGLLLLSDDLIELVRKQALESPKAGVRAWCRVTSTCKRLWDMQLLESSAEWHLDMGKNIRGESKVKRA